MESDHIEASDVAGAEFPMPEIDANGVARDQIRHKLALSPSERLHHVEVFAAWVLEVRKLNERAEISRDPPPPG
jgi:hypothetical protein